MRRHFLFPGQEHENGVGDGDANLLRLWLERRAQLLRRESLVRLLALFWDLAKDAHAVALSPTRYTEFFARVATALLQSVNCDGAPAIAQRDWLYDAEGNGGAAMPFEHFREAVLQVAELVLPVESDASMFESFFLELRECIATADASALTEDSSSAGAGGGPASDDVSSRTLQPSYSAPYLYEAAATFVLRPLRAVAKIRGAFLQKMPPGSEQLKAISALAPPNSQLMSLKQLLLSYNPRKFALSRKFSALFAGDERTGNQSGDAERPDSHHQLGDGVDEDRDVDTDAVSASCLAALAAVSAPCSSRILNTESEDDWDAELAAIRSLEQFPALRVAVVGPPHAGKTRVSRMLATTLRLRYFSIATALEDAVARKRARMALRASAAAAAAMTALSAVESEETVVAASDERDTDGDAADQAAETDTEMPQCKPAVEAAASAPIPPPEPLDEEDLLFSDADLDALCAGRALPRPKCLEVFVYYVRKSLLEGVGVVMDDVHPVEIEGEIGTDYLVALFASEDDVQQQAQRFTIAPTSRRVYSARERAVLEEDAAMIEALGFADYRCRYVAGNKANESVDDETVEGDADAKAPHDDWSLLHFAAAFSGRVYLAASRGARDAFCAHPLQFLRRLPQAKPFTRIWLVSSGGLSASVTNCLPALASAFGGLPALDAIDVLSKRSPMAVEMELMEGKPLAAACAAEIVAEVVRASTSGDRHGWVLANFPFTTESIAALKEHHCLPEVAIVLEPSQAAVDSQSNHSSDDGGALLTSLKVQHFQSALAAATDAANEVGVVVKRSPFHEDTADTVAALQRQVDPLAPRVDCVEDGHVTAEDLAAAFAAPSTPSSEGDDVESGATPARASQVGETSRFCPVSWVEKHTLVPGMPDFVAAFDAKFYCFAGRRELDAFERNPLKFVPSAHSATASLVPVILVLGVRGAEVAQLIKSVSTCNGNREYVVVSADFDLADAEFAKRLRTESLRSDELQRSPLALYAQVIKDELQRCEMQCREARTESVAEPNSGVGGDGCVLLGGLGADASRLPSPELLQICFQQDAFPLLVLPVQIDAEQAVQAQLREWKARQPEHRKKLTARRVASEEGDGGAEDSGDSEPDSDAEAAEAEETQRLQEQFQADQEALDAAVDVFRARGVAVAAPVDCSGSTRQSVRKLSTELDALMARKSSLFATTEVLASQEELAQALAAGELAVGKHGTTCPVALDGGSNSREAPSIVVYRERVYFPRGSDATARFRANPSRFVHEQRSIAPLLQPTCCVAGAPAVGKSQFAFALAAHYDLVYVSPRSAIDWALQCHGETALSRRLRAAQSAGAQPDANTVAEALAMRLLSSECQVRGWVLDDVFQQPADLQRFVQHESPSIPDPGVLFLLDGDFDTIWKRKKDRLVRLRTGSGAADTSEVIAQIARAEVDAARELLAHEFAAWQGLRLDLLSFWSLEFGSYHVRQLHATRSSLWRCVAQARECLDAVVARTRAHRQNLAAGRPARVDGVVVRSSVLRAQAHPVFQGFCPVELAASRYAASWTTTSRELCVQHGEHFVRLASVATLQQLIARPTEFLDSADLDDARALIAKAPLDASLLSLLAVADCEFPELRGYCPVTFKLGSGAKDWASIVPGHVFYRATYLHKVYFFASEPARRRFLREPALFAHQKLPVKLPPQLSAALAKSFPGKLEQELSAVLNESLLVLGSERPKFPLVSARASACVYLALLLKARAQKPLQEPARRALGDKRAAFERDCRLGETLKAASTPANASCGPAVRGVRAVLRDVGGATASEDELQALGRRFDAITGAPSASPSARAATARSSFFKYATLSTRTET
ncbi:hypothetical protein PybrP1_009402 [[Pythium] brassicae (nom. inval.)]|nr:hypothetical protein PybrP1_009402 [[Pythium] brassicae (nom. inval.)]